MLKRAKSSSNTKELHLLVIISRNGYIIQISSFLSTILGTGSGPSELVKLESKLDIGKSCNFYTVFQTEKNSV